MTLRPRTASLLGSIGFLLFLLSACHRAPLPPLDGTYLMNDGRPVLFAHNIFTAQATMGTGSYTLDGDYISLRLANGARLDGERMGADKIRFTQKDGVSVSPVDLYRQGSADAIAAQQASAQQHKAEQTKVDAAHDMQLAQEHNAVEQSAYEPDLSKPLGDYAALKTQEDLALLKAAFSATPWGDDALLDAFAPGYRTETDAFKRRDIAQRELPALRSRVEAANHAHYFSVPIVPAGVHAPGPAVSDVFLQAYDLDRHVFPYTFAGGPCWQGILPLDITVARVLPPCALPIADENLARQVETRRTGTGPLAISGTVYFCITKTAPAGQPPHATVTRVHLVLTDRTAPDFHYEADL